MSSKSFSTMIIIGIFGISLISLIILYNFLPEFEESEREYIHLPMNIEEAKILGQILSRYTHKYYFPVLGCVFMLYIFLQTFAIPGSIFLSILSGFLFPFYVAITLICFCSATGATLCYLISYFIGRRLVQYYFPDRIDNWSETVKEQRDNIINYIIFLRITPFLPNWFINIAAPILDVPIIPFWVGTFIGVAPPSFFAIQAGTTLHELTSTNSIVSWTSLLILCLVGLICLLPIAFKSFLKSKFE